MYYNHGIHLHGLSKRTALDIKQESIIINIYRIKATLLIRLARKLKYIIFVIIIANIKKALALKKYTNFTTKVLLEYYKHLIAFL